MIVKIFVRQSVNHPTYSFCVVPTIRIERTPYMDKNIRGRKTSVFLQIFLWCAGVHMFTFPKKIFSATDPYKGKRKK